MNTNDFDFNLPEELIAQTPLEKRDSSKLLVIDHKTHEMVDAHFDHILDELNPCYEQYACASCPSLR